MEEDATDLKDISVEGSGQVLLCYFRNSLRFPQTQFHLFIFVFCAFFLKGPIFKPSKLLCLAERPSPPINLDHSEQTKSSVKLKWEPPLKDGGSPILGYIIERREEGTDDWIRCNAKLAPKLSYTVSCNFFLERMKHWIIFRDVIYNNCPCLGR